MSVIVYGPPGCGKTTNAEVITDHFGLSSWIDGWIHGMPMPENALLLTQAYGIPGALHYFDVMREIDRERMREEGRVGYSGRGAQNHSERWHPRNRDFIFRKNWRGSRQKGTKRSGARRRVANYHCHRHRRDHPTPLDERRAANPYRS